MNTRIRSSILSLLFVIAPTIVSAQGADQSTPVLTMQPILTNLKSVGTAPAIGAQFAPVAVTSKTSFVPVSIPVARLSDGENVGKSRAMMGVGLAALIVGIIVGGDIGTIFMIGGGVLGLLGLYQYMR